MSEKAEKTMQVRLTTSRAGVDFAQVSGEVITVSTGEGKSLIEAGQAEPVAATRSKKTEKRVTAPTEKR